MVEAGGRLPLEPFNSRQINNDFGGPKKVKLLYTEDMLQKGVESLQINKVESLATNLEEGNF